MVRGILRSLTHHSCQGRPWSLTSVADDSSLTRTQTKRSLPRSSSCRTWREETAVDYFLDYRDKHIFSYSFRLTPKSWMQCQRFLCQERVRLECPYNVKLKSSPKQDIHLLALLRNSLRVKINNRITFLQTIHGMLEVYWVLLYLGRKLEDTDSLC